MIICKKFSNIELRYSNLLSLLLNENYTSLMLLKPRIKLSVSVAIDVELSGAKCPVWKIIIFDIRHYIQSVIYRTSMQFNQNIK